MIQTGKSHKEDTCMYEMMIISLVKGEGLYIYIYVNLYIHVDL